MAEMGLRLSRRTNTVFSSDTLKVVMLLTLVFALLAPALRAEFMWDDFTQIVESPTIGDLARVPFYFTHNVVQSAGSEGRGAEGVDTYRPLFMVALAGVYIINGADPFWFHLAVIAAHLLVCLLLWILAVRWLESQLAAAAAVFLFACHPVTAEAYLWCSAISEPLAAAGLLAAAVILDRGCNRTGNSTEAWIRAIAAATVLLAGLLCKEVVLMALLPLSLYLVTTRRLRARFLVPAWFAVGLFLLLRYSALGGMQASGVDPEQRLTALRIFPVLVLDGLRAMITMWPVGIRHLSWEYESVSWAVSFGAAILGGALLITAFALRRTTPLLLNAGLTTGLMLVPIAMVATVPGWGGFGRYLYVPLAFLLLALAEVGILSHRRIVGRNPNLWWAIPLIVVTAIAVEQIGLRHALSVYATQENLARAAIEISPDGPDGYEWLGNVYLDRGDLPAALECYRQATVRGPELYRPRHNLAAALLYSGYPSQALEQLAILERTHPSSARGLTIAARSLVALERWDEAAQRVLEELAQNSDDPEMHNLLEEVIASHPDPEGFRRRLHRGAEPLPRFSDTTDR
jgi:tetratricopeptide (TPR) repeat protein